MVTRARGALGHVLLNDVRKDETRRELESLAAQIDDWLESRTEKDTWGQYRTQLGHLRASLISALKRIREALGGVASNAPTTNVYATCRAYDDQLMLVRRVWQYYATKWAQRDDPTYRAVLACADEVVWSCHAEPMRVAGWASGDSVARPAPLPYIESAGTPSAILRNRPPEDLAADNDDELVRDYLQRLAVPVVALPARCVPDPWWLVLLGHEVGHHLQHDLVDDWALVGDFGALVEDAATGWRVWGEEIFADSVSVCAMGVPAVDAMAQVEYGDEAEMLSRGRVRYPPTVVRLALLSALAANLKLPAASAPGPDPAAFVNGASPEAAAAAKDLDRIPGLVTAIRSQPLGRLAPLPSLFGWDASATQATAFRREIAAWKAALLGEEPLVARKSTEAPRTFIAAAFSAWRDILREDDREKRRAALADAILEVLPECREDTTRAPEEALLPDSAALGRMFAETLLRRVAKAAPA